MSMLCDESLMSVHVGCLGIWLLKGSAMTAVEGGP